MNNKKLCIIAITPMFFSAAGVAVAGDITEEAGRAGRFEAFAVGTYLMGDKTEVKAPPGSQNFQQTVNYSSIYGGGIGAGYNFTDHFNLSLAVNVGESETEVTTTGNVAPGPNRGGNLTNGHWTKDCFAWGGEVLVDYNILKSRLTPVLEGGIGLRGIWDVPRTKEPMENGGDDRGGRSRDDASGSRIDGFFTVSGGGGLRWDINDHWFAKAIYKVGYYVALNNDLKDNLIVHGATLSIGYAF